MTAAAQTGDRPADSLAMVLLCTVPDAEAGRALARRLVGDGVAACVNLLPGVTSIFRWEGEIQEEREELLVIKTDARRVEALIELIEALHPYDCPEAIALPVAAGSARYLEWLTSSMEPVGEPGE